MRMINKSDPQEKSSYPHHIFQAKLFRRHCDACVDQLAELVVKYHDLLPVTPAFLCNSCFKMLTYRKDSSVIYKNVVEHPYFHE